MLSFSFNNPRLIQYFCSGFLRVEEPIKRTRGRDHCLGVFNISTMCSSMHVSSCVAVQRMEKT